MLIIAGSKGIMAQQMSMSSEAVEGSKNNQQQ